MRPGETPNHLKHGWQQSRHGSLQNRLGPISQQSGRVGRGSYARFKAEIELHNIRTKAKHESHPSGANFEFLCLAVRTSPPRHSRTPERELHPVTQRANHSEGAKNPPTFPAPCQVAGPRTSRPQGFNYYVYAKSAPSEVSGLVFHGVPKSARSTKIDRLLDLLEW